MLAVTGVKKTTVIQCATVPVTLGTATEWRSVYYLPVLGLKQGEMLQIYGEGQLANNTGYNVELAQCIELRTSVNGGNEPLGSVGGYTGPINGWDVDPAMHYGRWSKSEAFVAEKDYPTLYLVARIRCRSTGAKPGDTLLVNSGQGHLYYIRYS